MLKALADPSEHGGVPLRPELPRGLPKMVSRSRRRGREKKLARKSAGERRRRETLEGRVRVGGVPPDLGARVALQYPGAQKQL